METRSENLITLLFNIIVLTLIIASLILAARNAADGYMYNAWAEYFATSDLVSLSAFPKSITGVPFVHWSYGSGLLPASAAIFGLTNPLSIYSVAAFLGIACSSLLVYIAHSRTGSLTVSTLILASVILFTPSGFYFNKYTSEGWTIFLVLAGLGFIEWNRRYKVRANNITALMLGIVFYFLLLVKIQNIVICFTLWIVFIATNFAEGTSPKENLKYVLHKTIIIAAVSLIALLFLFAYNHVVNGNFLTSPYSVGDAEYSTFSFRNLKTWEVLFSPLHGLLLYHPFVGIAVLYLLRELYLERASVFKPEFMIICTCLFAVLLQLLIQSAWVIWWMGIGTFGARGFSGVIILLVYALLQCKPSNRPRLTGSIYWTFFILAVVSSYLVTLEETSIINMEDILQYVGHKNSISALVMISCGFGILHIIKTRLNLDQATYLACLLIVLSLVPVINAVIRDVFFFDQFQETVKLIIKVTLYTFTGLLLAYNLLFDKVIFVGHIIKAIMLAIFAASIVLQTELILDFNMEAKSSTHKGKLLDCNEYVSSYNEYLRISGYEQEKQELHDFLVRQQCYN